jgi:signal transduction histidine kinase
MFYAHAVVPGMVICLAMITASLYGTVVALLRGHRQARMLLPVFVLFWVVAMLRIGTFMGVLPAWWLVDYTHGWTVVIAGLLMTLSLIDKVLDVNLERMRVQQELLRGQVRAREQLESEVLSRTAELQDAKEKAERADASKSRFLAQLSHELRTPLHSVLGNAGLMLGEKRNEDDSRRLQAMQRSGRHLLALIEEVLEFVRGDAGRTELTVRPVWLRDLLKGVVEEMQPLSRTSSVNLLLQVDPELPDGVVLDPVRLRQVLINLVGNACRHSHGTVVSVQAHLVSVDEDSAIVRFEIHDDGEGVDDGERDALFDPFWQAASADRRSGLGLGLPISRQWVRLMGGDIAYEARPNGGSLFCFTLALQRAQPDARPEPVVPVPSGSAMLASGTWQAMPGPLQQRTLQRPSAAALARLRLAAGLGLITDIDTWVRVTGAAEPQAAEFVAAIRLALGRVDLAEIRRLAQDSGAAP